MKEVQELWYQHTNAIKTMTFLVVGTFMIGAVIGAAMLTKNGSETSND